MYCEHCSYNTSIGVHMNVCDAMHVSILCRSLLTRRLLPVVWCRTGVLGDYVWQRSPRPGNQSLFQQSPRPLQQEAEWSWICIFSQANFWWVCSPFQELDPTRQSPGRTILGLLSHPNCGPTSVWWPGLLCFGWYSNMWLHIWCCSTFLVPWCHPPSFAQLTTMCLW